MDNAILQLGVGGIFALMILKAVFDFIKSWQAKRESQPPDPDLDKEKEDTLRLHVHDMHTHTLPALVETTRKLVDAHASMSKVIVQQEQSMQMQNKTLQQLADTQEEQLACQRDLSTTLKTQIAEQRVKDQAIERIERRLSGLAKPPGGE